MVVREVHKEPTRRAIMILLPGGRTTGKNGLQQIRAVAARIHRQALAATVIIGCERSRIRLGLVQELNVELGANYVNPSELSAETVVGVVHAYH